MLLPNLQISPRSVTSLQHCSLQPAATCCKLLMQIFDKCIWSILLWVGTSCQAATFSFNIARHSFYIFHNPQWTQSYASNEPLNVGWERNKIPVDKVNHLLVSLSQFPQSWLEFVRVYRIQLGARCDPACHRQPPARSGTKPTFWNMSMWSSMEPSWSERIWFLLEKWR